MSEEKSKPNPESKPIEPSRPMPSPDRGERLEELRDRRFTTPPIPPRTKE